MNKQCFMKGLLFVAFLPQTKDVDFSISAVKVLSLFCFYLITTVCSDLMFCLTERIRYRDREGNKSVT